MCYVLRCSAPAKAKIAAKPKTTPINTPAAEEPVSPFKGSGGSAGGDIDGGGGG